MLEGKHQRDPLDPEETADAGREQRPRDLARSPVIGKGLARAAEEVAWKLIEEDDQGDALLARQGADVPDGRRGFRDERTELFADRAVGRVRSLIPDRRSLLVEVGGRP